MTKVVLRIDNLCNCKGHLKKVDKVLSKTKGIEGMLIVSEKGLLEITGTVDTKNLVKKLEAKLKRYVEIIDDGEKKEVAPTKTPAEEKKEVAPINTATEELEEKKVDTTNSSTENSKENVDTSLTKEEEPSTSEFGLKYEPAAGYAYTGAYQLGNAYSSSRGYTSIFSDDNPSGCSIM